MIREVALGLAAGCTAVVKPSDPAPWSALALALALAVPAERARIPTAVIGALTG